MNSLEKLKKTALDFGVDALVITNPSTLHYLSGYANEEAIIYFENSKAWYITDSRYSEEVGNCLKNGLSYNGGIELFESGDYFKGVQTLSTKGLSVGFEASISFNGYMNMKKSTEFKSACDVSVALNKFREVKTDEEIALIKKAAQISDYALDKIMSEVKVGMTESQVQAKLEYYMISSGARSTSFQTIVAFGAGGSQPHHHTSDAVYKEGDLVTIDCGADFFGYKSDITRTFAPSVVDERKIKLYNIVERANALGISLVKEGAVTGEIDNAVREFLKGYGLDQYFTHSLGHGVGLDIHEAPYLKKTNDYVLKNGNIVTIEPGIYIPGELGIRVEDLLLVKKDGYELLSHCRKDLY